MLYFVHFYCTFVTKEQYHNSQPPNHKIYTSLVKETTKCSLHILRAARPPAWTYSVWLCMLWNRHDHSTFDIVNQKQHIRHGMIWSTFCPCVLWLNEFQVSIPTPWNYYFVIIVLILWELRELYDSCGMTRCMDRQISVTERTRDFIFHDIPCHANHPILPSCFSNSEFLCQNFQSN